MSQSQLQGHFPLKKAFYWHICREHEQIFERDVILMSLELSNIQSVHFFLRHSQPGYVRTYISNGCVFVRAKTLSIKLLVR